MLSHIVSLAFVVSATTSGVLLATTFSENSDVALDTSSKLTYIFREENNCLCDKDPTICEDNCCCDIDCSVRDTAFFSICVEGIKINPPANRKCSEADLGPREYHIPILELELTVTDVLCLEFDNFPKKSDENGPNILTSVDQLQKFNNEQAHLVLEKVDEIVASQYLAGRLIYSCKFDQSQSDVCIFGYFGAPGLSPSGRCVDDKPVVFMKDAKFFCNRKIPESLNFAEACQAGTLPSWLLDSTYRSGFEIVRTVGFLKNLKISSGPESLFTHASVDDNNANGSHNLTVPIKAVCKRADTHTETQCLSNSDRLISGGGCLDVVKSVSYKIAYSNGSIEDIVATIFLGKLNEEEIGGFSQEFSISFEHVITTQEVFTVNSGNPGYLFGKPILAGLLQKRTTGDLSKPSFRMNVPVSSSEWLTSFDVENSKSGLCSSDVRKPVLFGINLAMGCALPFEFDCTTTQQKIQSTFFGSGLQHTHVGMFGNSNASRPGEWISIRGKDSANIAVGDTLAGACENLRTSVVLRISYVLTGSQQNPQPQIIDAEYEYGSPRRYTIPCLGVTCSSDELIYITFEVLFEDLSQPSTARIAPSRQIEGQLPSDFFYPFLVGPNNSNTLEICCSKRLIMVLFTFILLTV